MAKLLRVFKSFSGGLSEVANDNMRDDELSYAKNTVPGDTYGLSRCNGTTKPTFPTQVVSGKRVKRVVELTTASATLMLAFVESATAGKEELYKLNETATPNVWEAITESGVETPLQLDAVKSWFIHANKLYWLDGTKLKCYDGSTVVNAVLVDSTPSSPVWADFSTHINTAVYVARRGQRWFYATTTNEVIFSEVGSPLSFKATSVININTPDNDQLTALHEFNEDLLIFKKHSVHRLTGWDFTTAGGVSLSRINVTTGTEYPDTIQIVQNAILFLGNNGIYRLYVPYYTSIIATQNVSERKINNRLFTDGKPEAARSVVWNGVYYLSVDYTNNGTLDSKEYRYYIDEKSCWGEFTQGVACYMPGLRDSDKLYIGCDNGYILYYDPSSNHYVDTATGSYTDIPLEVHTKGYDVAGATFQDAKLKKLFISAKQYEANSTDLRIEIKADYVDGAWGADFSRITQESMIDTISQAMNGADVSFDESLIWEEGQYFAARWGWSDTVSKQIPIGRKTKHLQFILKSTEQQPLVIYALGVVYKKKKVKGSSEGVTMADYD